MLKTSLRIWGLRSQCGTYILHSLRISIEKDVPMINEFYHRRLHSLLSATLNARKSEHPDIMTSLERDDGSNISQWWVDYKKRKTFKERCVGRISRALGCSELRSTYFIGIDALTFLDRIDSTIEIIEYLIQNGITADSITANISILRLSKNDMEFRIEHMKRWGIDQKYYSDFLTVFKLPTAYFLLISNQFIKERSQNIPDGNRVIHFAKLLGVEVPRVNRAFVRCRQLYKFDFDEIKSALLCYLEFGVTPEYILKDISGLRMDVKIIKQRLAGPFEKGLQPLRPNLVMCSQYMYHRKCRQLERHVNLWAPYENRHEYLEAKLFSRRHHISDHRKQRLLLHFDSIDAKKLIGILEFLLEKNYSVNQIIVNLLLFCFDVESLKERYAKLQQAGIQSPSAKMLTKSEDRFEEFIKRQMFQNTIAKQCMAEMAPLMNQDTNKPKTGAEDEE